MSAKIKRFLLLVILLPLLLLSSRLLAAPTAQTVAYQKVKNYTESKNPVQVVLSPEREFITCFTESINTIVINRQRSYLPSPITPLNWAKAGLNMALDKYETVIGK